jgi:FHS family glucose/mannose:H+ symporter-like MFS transporter
LACGALLALALAGPPVSPWFRMGGLFLVGTAMGLLNMGLFHAVSNSYTREPAVTVNLGGIFYGIGCMAAPMLVAGTFYIYTVGSILTLIAAVPAFFAGIYAKTPFPQTPRGKEPSIRQALQDFRSPAAVLFALLLFFQFGNEWSIAGWLPLFLIRRLGISSETSLFMLALYWMALLVGRLAAVAVLPRVRHGRLLLYSAAASLFGCVILLSTTNTFGAGTGVLMVGGGFAQVYPLVAEKIGRRFPYYHPGFFNGIFTFGVMGGLLAPASLGYLSAALDSIQVVMVLPFFGICMVCILLLLMWLESKLTQG